MAWKGYRLIYRALSPIHIGSYTLGYINLTRRYITGRAMWGALTANLVRTGFNGLGYESVGELLKKDVLVSYFFSALEPGNPFLPWFGEDGLRYGISDPRMKSDQFEQKFVRSMGQTAIDTRTWSAEDQTLHESEYLVPRIQCTEGFKQLLFIGYLFIKDDCILIKDNCSIKEIIKKAWGELFVGGDRKYGWGRLILDSENGLVEDNNLFDYKLESDEDNLPRFSIPKNKPVPAHVLVSENVKLKGDIEFLASLEYDNERNMGFGHKITKESGLYWIPGSILIENDSLSLGAYGIMGKER